MAQYAIIYIIAQRGAAFRIRESKRAHFYLVEFEKKAPVPGQWGEKGGAGTGGAGAIQLKCRPTLTLALSHRLGEGRRWVQMNHQLMSRTRATFPQDHGQRKGCQGKRGPETGERKSSAE